MLPVSHLHHENQESLVPNLPRPDMDAAELLLRLHLLHSMRTWILFQTEKIPVHLLAEVRIELADVFLSGRSDFDAIGQDSVSQFPHQVPEWNRPLLFRLLQGGAGVFEVDSVHFFLGQALQEMEVFYRDDSGQVLPTTGDNGPLTCTTRTSCTTSTTTTRIRHDGRALQG